VGAPSPFELERTISGGSEFDLIQPLQHRFVDGEEPHVGLACVVPLYPGLRLLGAPIEIGVFEPTMDS
jgi:hypothetical protein